MVLRAPTVQAYYPYGVLLKEKGDGIVDVTDSHHKSRQEETGLVCGKWGPIRYSIREHGLISGLYCHTYPENYESIGSLKFAKKYFQQPPKKKGDDPPELKVTAADVLKKLKKMKYDGSHERLRMAVLYFLATVIFQRSRYGTPIDHFLLRMVNDLRVCHTFPWGRFTFNDSLKEIKHMVKHFRGKIPTVKASWTFPGFINPLEVIIVN